MSNTMVANRPKKMEVRRMRNGKMSRLSGDLTIQVGNGSRNIFEVIVRDTHEKISLEGKTYSKYQIIKPSGLEGEEVFHRPERGYEALLSVVFTALAEATRKK